MLNVTQPIQSMTLHLGVPVLGAGVEISSIADYTVKRGVLWRNRRIDGISFVFCHNGALNCKISDGGGGGVILCRPDEMHVFFPGRSVTFASSAASTHFTLLELTGPHVVRSVLRLGYWDGFHAPVCSENLANAFGAIIPQMEASDLRGQDGQTLARLESTLDSVWHDCRNLSGRERFFDVAKAIGNLPPNVLSTEKVAETMGMSRTKLNSVFMSGCGERPGSYLSRLKVAIIRELLSNTSLSVAQIAMRIGFSSASALAFFFRRRVGVAPRRNR